MICPYCKNEIKDNSKFCGLCGKKIDIEIQKPKERKNYLLIIMSIITGTLLLVFVGLLLFGSSLGIKKDKEEESVPQEQLTTTEEKSESEIDIDSISEKEKLNRDPASVVWHKIENRYWCTGMPENELLQELFPDCQKIGLYFTEDRKCVLAGVIESEQSADEFKALVCSCEIKEDKLLISKDIADGQLLLQMDIPKDVPTSSIWFSANSKEYNFDPDSYDVEAVDLSKKYDLYLSFMPKQNGSDDKYISSRTTTSNSEITTTLFSAAVFDYDGYYYSYTSEYNKDNTIQTDSYYDADGKCVFQLVRQSEYNKDGFPISTSIKDPKGGKLIKPCYTFEKNGKSYKVDVLPKYDVYMNDTFQKTVNVDISEQSGRDLLNALQGLIVPQKGIDYTISVADFYERRVENSHVVYSLSVYGDGDKSETYYGYDNNGVNTSLTMYSNGEVTRNDTHIIFKGRSIGRYSCSNDEITGRLDKIDVNLDENGNYVVSRRSDSSNKASGIYDQDGYKIGEITELPSGNDTWIMNTTYVWTDK